MKSQSQHAWQYRISSITTDRCLRHIPACIRDFSVGWRHLLRERRAVHSGMSRSRRSDSCRAISPWSLGSAARTRRLSCAQSSPSCRSFVPLSGTTAITKDTVINLIIVPLIMPTNGLFTLWCIRQKYVNHVQRRISSLYNQEVWLLMLLAAQIVWYPAIIGYWVRGGGVCLSSRQLTLSSYPTCMPLSSSQLSNISLNVYLICDIKPTPRKYLLFSKQTDNKYVRLWNYYNIILEVIIAVYVVTDERRNTL